MEKLLFESEIKWLKEDDNNPHFHKILVVRTRNFFFLPKTICENKRSSHKDKMRGEDKLRPHLLTNNQNENQLEMNQGQ